MTITLSPETQKLLEEWMKKGGFATADDVVRLALQTMEEIKADQERQDLLKLQALRTLTAEGFDQIDRGEFEVVDPTRVDEFLARLEANARAAGPR